MALTRSSESSNGRYTDEELQEREEELFSVEPPQDYDPTAPLATDGPVARAHARLAVLVAE